MQSGLPLCYVVLDCAKRAAIILCGLSLYKVGRYYAMRAVIVQIRLLLCYAVLNCATWAAIMLCGL